MGQGINRPKLVNAGQRWHKLDTVALAVNRPIESRCSTLLVDRRRRLTWEPRAGITRSRGSEAGKAQ